MMMEQDELRASLAGFTGTETWTKHGLFPCLVMTEGVCFLRERAECFWLVDAIGSHIATNPLLGPRYEPFQFWRFAKGKDGAKHLLSVSDGGEEGREPIVLIRQEIEYTDFPLNSIDLWAVWDDGFAAFVLMLPSEH